MNVHFCRVFNNQIFVYFRSKSIFVYFRCKSISVLFFFFGMVCFLFNWYRCLLIFCLDFFFLLQNLVKIDFALFSINVDFVRFYIIFYFIFFTKIMHCRFNLKNKLIFNRSQFLLIFCLVYWKVCIVQCNYSLNTSVYKIACSNAVNVVFLLRVHLILKIWYGYFLLLTQFGLYSFISTITYW